MLTCAAARWAACVDGATLALAEVAAVVVGVAAVLTEALAAPVAWLLIDVTLALVVVAVVTLANATFAVAALTDEDEATAEGLDAVEAPQAASSARAGSPIAAEAIRVRKSRRLPRRCPCKPIAIFLSYPVCHSRCTPNGTSTPGAQICPGLWRALISSSQRPTSKGSPRSASGKRTLRPLRCAA
jgi:hypothetical protein